MNKPYTSTNNPQKPTNEELPIIRSGIEEDIRKHKNDAKKRLGVTRAGSSSIQESGQKIQLDSSTSQSTRELFCQMCEQCNNYLQSVGVGNQIITGNIVNSES